MATEGVALRKRQQIAKANRTMFLWVAGVSVVVGVSLVSSIFLVQKVIFNERVLAEKSKTASTLVKNNKVVEELQNQVRILNTNDDLKKLMIPGQSQPIQVVLDALPSEANSSAFGSSLQQKLLSVDGVQIESLSVDPVANIEVIGLDDVVGSVVTGDDSQDNQIFFRFEVSVDADNPGALKTLLEKLERSIRPIDITTATLEAETTRMTLKVAGKTYYEPAKTVDLKEKTIKP